MSVIPEDDNLAELDALFGYTPKKRQAPAPDDVDVTDLLERMRGGVFKQESGGNYQVKPNARTGATGGFQVLPENIPAWTQTYLGRRLTREQFEADPQAQESVFTGEMGKYLKKARAKAPDDDTALRMAAAAWYGGEGRMDRYDDPVRFRPNEPSFREYTMGVLNKSKPVNRPIADNSDLADLDKLFGYTGPTKGGPSAPNDLAELDSLFGYNGDNKGGQPSPTNPTQAPFKVNPLPPVPETKATLDVQARSVADPASPKAAILFTPGETRSMEQFDPKQFGAFPTKDGVLVVNLEKARKLKLKTPQDIQTFLDRNPDGMARLIGKVDNVGNETGTGQAVMTTLPDGTEASSSIVRSPETAEMQIRIDQEAFPGSQSQVVNAQDVVQKRIQDQQSPLRPLANEVQRQQVLSAMQQGEAPTDTILRQRREPTEAAYRDFLAQTGLPDNEASMQEFNLAQNASVQGANAQNAQDVAAYNANLQSQQPVVRENRTTPTGGNVPPVQATEQASTGSDGPVDVEITLTDKPASKSYSDWVDEKRASALAIKLGADYDTVRSVLKSFGNPTVGESSKQADEDYYAGLAQQGDQNKFQVGSDVVRAIKLADQTNKKRKAAAESDFERRKSEIDPNLSGADRDAAEFEQRMLADVDAGLVSPVDAVKAVDKLKQDVEAWKQDRGFFGLLDQEQSATLQAGLSAGGRKYSEDLTGGVQFDGKAKSPKELFDRAYADVKKQYGSISEWADAQREFKKRFKDSPNLFLMKAGETAVGAAVKAPLKGVSSALKTISIAAEAIDRGLGDENADATKMGFYQMGKALDEITEGVIKTDQDFKGGSAELFGDVFGQVATQIGLGLVTGGAAAPALFGAGMGAAAEFEEADKRGATGWERLGAAGVGGVLAASDYILFRKWFGSASPADKGKFLQRFRENVRTSLETKGVIRSAADKAAVQMTDGMLATLAKQGGIKGVIGRGGQQVTSKGKEGLKEAFQEGVFETKGNDLYAYLTYDPTPERLDELTRITGENLIEGVAGFFGGVIGASAGEIARRAGSLSPEAVAQAEAVVEKLEDALPPETLAETRKAFAKAKRQTVNVEPIADATTLEPESIPAAEKSEKPIIPDVVSPLDSPEKMAEMEWQRELAKAEDDPDYFPNEALNPANKQRVMTRSWKDALDNYDKNETKTEVSPLKPSLEPDALVQDKPVEVPDAVPVKQYPVADKNEWYSDADYQQRGGKMVEMSPDQYLKQTRPLVIDDISRDNIDDLKRHIQSGRTLDPLKIYEDGKEDGRHRAVAAKELGIAKVPVIQFSAQTTKPAEATDSPSAIAATEAQVTATESGRKTASKTNEVAPKDRPEPIVDRTKNVERRAKIKEAAAGLFKKKAEAERESSEIPVTQQKVKDAFPAKADFLKTPPKEIIAEAMNEGEPSTIWKYTKSLKGAFSEGYQEIRNGKATGKEMLPSAAFNEFTTKIGYFVAKPEAETPVSEPAKPDSEKTTLGELQTGDTYKSDVSDKSFTVVGPGKSADFVLVEDNEGSQFDYPAKRAIPTANVTRSELSVKANPSGKTKKEMTAKEWKEYTTTVINEKLKQTTPVQSRVEDQKSNKAADELYHAGRPAKVVGFTSKKQKIQYLDGDKETAFVKKSELEKAAPAKAVKKPAATAQVAPVAETPARVKKYAAQGLSEAEVAAQINDPEFKAAEEASKKQKPSATTGFTKAQQGYLIKELEEYAAEYPEGAAYEGKKQDLKLGERGVADSSLEYRSGDRIKPETIIVPDDGTVTVNDMRQANRLYQRLAGKPIKGQEKEKLKNVSLPAPPSDKPTGISAKRTLSDLGATVNDEYASATYGPGYDGPRKGFEMDVPIDEVDTKYLSGSKKLEASPFLLKTEGNLGSGWMRTTVKGKRAWTDGKMLLVSDDAPGSGTTKQEPDSEKVLKHALDALNIKPVRPMRAVEGIDDALIEFDDGWQIPFEQYQLIKAHYPNVIFEHGEAAEVDEARPFIAYNGKDVVGLIMPVSDRDDATAKAAKRAERYQEADPRDEVTTESLQKAMGKAAVFADSLVKKANTQAETPAKEKSEAQIDAYLATLTPLQAGRVRKRLEKQTRHKGTLTTVGGLIETFISEGAELTTSKQLHDLTAAERRKYNDEIKQLRRDMTNDRALRESEMPRLTLMVDALNVGYELREVDILKHPDGSVLDNENVGSLAMDYARYLSKAPEPKPEAPAAESKVAEEAEKALKKPAKEKADIPTVPITDFGEKIGGARKDMWAGRGLTTSDLAGMTAREKHKLVKKDQVWSKPDYQEINDRFEAAGIADPQAHAYAVKMIYDGLAQPNEQFKQFTDEDWDAYVNGVIEVRDTIGELLQTPTAKWYEGLMARLFGEDIVYRTGGRYINPKAEGYAKLRLIGSTKFINAIPSSDYSIRSAKLKADKINFPSKREAWMNKFAVQRGELLGVSPGSRRIDGERVKYYSVSFYGKGTGWVNLAEFETEQEASDFKKTLFGKWALVSARSPKEWKGEQYKLFESEAEAVAEAKSLHKKVAGRREDEPTRPQLEGINREGVDYRKGKPATPEQFTETFGFRGVEFGNWLNAADRQQSLDHAFDALMDLAGVMKVAPKALSLNGNLGLAFGARGKGGKNTGVAHYEPSKVVINLTKMSGAGSLAHEWGHAVDDYFGSLAAKANYRTDPHKGYASQGSMRSGLRPEMQEAWRTVVSSILEREATPEETVLDARKAVAKQEAIWDSWIKYIYQDADGIGAANKKFHEAIAQGVTINTGPYSEFAKAAGKIKGIKSKQAKSLNQIANQIIRAQTDLQKAIAGEMVKKIPTNFKDHAKNLDTLFRSKPYFDTTLELFARAFESYVQDKTGGKSQYLVHGTDTKTSNFPKDLVKSMANFEKGISDEEAGNTLPINMYPEGQERDFINAAFDNFVETLEQEETDDGNVILRSVPGFENTEFEQRPVLIEELLKRDADLREYVEKNNPEPSRKKLGEVVLAMKPRGGIVVKGMRAIAQAISNGKKTINAMVQTNEPYLMSVAGEAQTKTPAFKRWFKDSKVVDENGEPLVVYHGGAPDVEVFDPSKAGTVNTADWGRGVYFTPVKWMAESYGTDWAAVNDARSTELWERLHAKAKEYGTDPMSAWIDLSKSEPEKYAEIKELTDEWRTSRESARKNGGQVYPVYISLQNPLIHRYGEMTDPFLAEDARESGHDGIIIIEKHGGIGEVIAFEPTQIKSAIGNRGTFDPNDPNILRKVRTPEAYNELKALKQADDFSEIVPKIKTSVDGNTIALESSEAAEAVRTLLAFAFDTKREAQPLLEGLFLEPKNVEKLLEAADAFAEATEENGVDPEPMNELVRNIAAASKENGTIKLHVFDDTLKHEEIHEGSYLGADGKRFEARYANSKELKADPVFKRFHKELDRIQGHVTMQAAVRILKRGGDPQEFGLTQEEADYLLPELTDYTDAEGVKALPKALTKSQEFRKFKAILNQTKSSHGVAMEEALAYLGVGDYARFGLTESEAVDILEKLVVGYADANGVESLKNFKPETKLYEAIESYRESQRSGERDASRSGRSDAGREAGPSETAREPDPDREGRGETDRSGSDFQPGGREKLSKTPKTLRNAGIAANDRLYSSTTNAERKNFADEIMNRGLGEAIDWLETQAADGNNNAGATAIVGITVMNELGKRGQIAELNRIADAVLPMVTDAAQTVQAISVVSMYSPDTAVPYATKAAKQAGKDLSPRDAERAGDIARRMSETVQALAIAEASLANADALNQQLREEINELEDALDISKSKNREFKTKLSGMGRTIAALRRQIEGIFPTRTRTSKEVRERINEIASRKDDIVANLKAKYGVSEILRMVAGMPTESLLAPNGKRSNLPPYLYKMVRTPEFKAWFGDWEKAHDGSGGNYVWSHDDISHVVDENGEPKIVYHGTKRAGFDRFSTHRDSKVEDTYWFTSDRDSARSYSGAEWDEAQIRSLENNEADVAAWWNDEGGANREESWNDLTPEWKQAAFEDWDAEIGQYEHSDGIYSVFLNIRNPHESYFEGANWDGSRSDQWVVRPEEEDGDPLVYNEAGRGYFNDKEEAERLAAIKGGTVDKADWHFETTDSAAREGKRYGDGTIIHEVTDSGSDLDFFEPITVYVANEPTQIKSINNYGTFNPNDPSILRAVPDEDGTAPERDGLDPDLLDYAILHLANNLKTISPQEFKDAINVLTNGHLTLDEIDAVHAHAVGQLRSEPRGVAQSIKEANKNRQDHYRTADEYNLSLLDYKGFKVATKAEKRIAEAILRAGQDYSDEAVWTALARMKYKDPSELIRELRNEFEDLQNEKDVLADSQRIVLAANQLMYGDRMRKKDATLTDSDLEIIREHRRVLTGTKGRIAREATNFYSGLVKSRAEIVLGSVVDFRRANLLSAVKTHLVNIFGNTGFAASEEIAKAPATMIDMAAAMFTNERTIALTPTAINRGLKALVAKDETLANANWESPEGREAGIKAARHVLMYGGSLADMERHQYSESILQETYSGRLPKWVDNYINYSFRTLGAEDAFFKVYSFRRHIEEQAKAIALTEKRQGELEGSVEDRRAELVRKPTNVMQVIADNYAHMMTFQNDNALSSLIATIKRGRPVLKAAIETIVPYDRTPTNIVIRTLEYTPLGVPMAVYAIKGKKPSKEFRNVFTMPVTADVAGSTEIQKLTKEQRAAVEDQINRLWTREKQANFSRAMARASVGSSLFGVGFALAALGLMAGAMDFDDKDKNEKDLAWQRKSEGIESGSIWLPMLGIRIQLPMSPATVMLTAGATFYEQIRMSKKDTALAAMDAGVESFTDIAEKQPYINSTYGLMKNLGKEKYGEFTGNLLSGYVPASAMVRSISEVTDEKERAGSGFRKGENLKNSSVWWNRQWRGFRNSLLKGVPGARNYLVDESTSSVSPQERGNIPRRIVRMLDPFNTRTGKPSPVPEGMKPGQDTRPFKDTPEARKMTTDDVVSMIQFEREGEKDVSDLVEILMQKAKNAHNRKTLTDAEIQNIRKVLPEFKVADLAKVKTPKKPKRVPGAKLGEAGQ